MAKGTSYVCSECGSSVSRWSGQCPECGAWNTITEVVNQGPSKPF